MQVISSISLVESEPLAGQEQAEIKAQLEAAGDRIAQGHFVVFDRQDQMNRFERSLAED